MSKKNRTFVLRDINTEEVDSKYDIKLISNISNTNDLIPKNTTKISELTDKNTTEIVSFLDETKRLHKCNISMVDFKNKEELNDYMKYNCFWCRHPFDTRPLGCPISYVSKIATTTYVSEISRETYSIKENITQSKCFIKKRNDKNTLTKNCEVNENNYYQTDGIFCSFNCISAFIIDNKHNRLYDLSRMLLIKMYNDIMNTKNTEIVIIKSAPHWKLLTEYGGHLNIKEFRSGFNKIDYDTYGYIKNFPEFNPLGQLFEQKIKF